MTVKELKDCLVSVDDDAVVVYAKLEEEATVIREVGTIDRLEISREMAEGDDESYTVRLFAYEDTPGKEKGE